MGMDGTICSCTSCTNVFLANTSPVFLFFIRLCAIRNILFEHSLRLSEEKSPLLVELKPVRKQPRLQITRVGRRSHSLGNFDAMKPVVRSLAAECS